MITGAARSGKSSFAQKMAGQIAQKDSGGNDGVVYLATSLPGDEEMMRRIELHRRSRPVEWTTVEEPRHLCQALDKLPPTTRVVLVDCLTTWLTNLLFSFLEKEGASWTLKENSWHAADDSLSWGPSLQKEAEIEGYIYTRVEEFLDRMDRFPGKSILVTNEVGWGIVPEHYLGRLFRDIAGKVNQRIASRAEEVYLVVAGIPLKIKG